MPAAPEGLLVVDKSAGWTSHDVVARTRRLAGTRRVGHAGTLDPLATGVLVLGIGRATKLLTHLVGADKEYLATMVLGQTTVTDDAEGEVLQTAPLSAFAALTEERVVAATVALTGSIDQVPSSVSAIKVDGQRSYARVRAGEDVVLPARPVVVSTFDVLAVRAGEQRWEVDVRVVVSSGTYVRALARDVGADLAVGGHLSALRRSRVGPFGLDGASTLEQLGALVGDDAQGARELPLISMADAARRTLPTREVDAEEARELGHGRRITPTGEGSEASTAVEVPVVGAPAIETSTVGAPTVAAIGPDGTLVALLRDEGGRARPVLVLVPAT